MENPKMTTTTQWASSLLATWGGLPATVFTSFSLYDLQPSTYCPASLWDSCIHGESKSTPYQVCAWTRFLWDLLLLPGFHGGQESSYYCPVFMWARAPLLFSFCHLAAVAHDENEGKSRWTTPWIGGCVRLPLDRMPVLFCRSDLVATYPLLMVIGSSGSPGELKTMPSPCLP